MAQDPTLLQNYPIERARAALLAWYDEHQRALPWRGIHDPWATWVSEVMLQQTRVSSVLDYFSKFMERFPTPSALAEAPWEEVSSLWAGLGYYSRARNLQEGARQVVERHGGEVPDTLEEIKALKGVGPYTAGAIASIAFGHPAPIVDGNVARVFSRLYHLSDDIQLTSTQRQLWTLAAQWAQGERPGDLNQALMELGATRCTPKSPTCLICPLREVCRAHDLDIAALLPHKKRRAKKSELPVEVYLAPLSMMSDDHEKIWVTRRKSTGLLGGLWGLPLIRWSLDEGLLQEALQCHQEERPLKAETRLLIEERLTLRRAVTLTRGPTAYISHTFTHKTWRVYVCDVEGVPTLSDDEELITPYSAERLSEMGVNGPSLKAMRAVGIKLKARRGAGSR